MSDNTTDPNEPNIKDDDINPRLKRVADHLRDTVIAEFGKDISIIILTYRNDLGETEPGHGAVFSNLSIAELHDKLAQAAMVIHGKVSVKLKDTLKLVETLRSKPTE